MTLDSALAQRLHDLLPPERRPRPGGAADDLVQILGSLEAQTARDAFTMLFLWLVSTTSKEGLEIIGWGRYLRRFPNEALDVYRNRVAGAFDFWEQAGTLPGMILALAQAGWDAEVTEHYHDEPRYWAEFSVTINNYPIRAGEVPTYGNFRLGDGTHWGNSRGGDEDLTIILVLIHEVKPAHARLRTLTLRSRPLPRWGDFDWTDGTRWGGVIARYNFIPRWGVFDWGQKHWGGEQYD